MKNIQEKLLWNLEKSFENYTDFKSTIVWVFKFNTEIVVIFVG